MKEPKGISHDNRIEISVPDNMDRGWTGTFVNKETGDKTKLVFFAPTEVALFRYKTILGKEPETIRWLDTLDENDILFDVGANIGIYTLYGAALKGCRVVAIEPGYANYWTLCQNIQLNKLDKQVKGYCLALGSEDKTADLFSGGTHAGEALIALDRPLDDAGTEFNVKFVQGMLSMRLDTLIQTFGAPCPTAMKIDVDGFEIPLIEGATSTLKNEILKKISIEMNLLDIEKCNRINQILLSNGFKLLGAFREIGGDLSKSPVRNFHYERS